MKNANQIITVDAWYHSPSCSITGRAVSENSMYSQNGCYNSHVGPLCGTCCLGDVPRSLLAGLLTEMHNSGYSFGTIFGTYAVLTRIFRSAYLAGVITEYPCEGLHALIMPWNTYEKQTI